MPLLLLAGGAEDPLRAGRLAQHRRGLRLAQQAPAAHLVLFNLNTKNNVLKKDFVHGRIKRSVLCGCKIEVALVDRKKTDRSRTKQH